MDKIDKEKIQEVVRENSKDNLLNSYTTALEIILLQTEKLVNIVDIIDTDPSKAKRQAEKALTASQFLLENAGILNYSSKNK
jgi:hypothetical protein